MDAAESVPYIPVSSIQHMGCITYCSTRCPWLCHRNVSLSRNKLPLHADIESCWLHLHLALQRPLMARATAGRRICPVTARHYHHSPWKHYLAFSCPEMLLQKHSNNIILFVFMVHKDLLHWPEPALLAKQPAAEPMEGAGGGGGW